MIRQGRDRAALVCVLAVLLSSAGHTHSSKAASHEQAQNGPRISATRVLDNDRVSVSRLTFPPGVREAVHITPQDLVVIQASTGDVEVTLADQTTSGRVEPGKTWYVSKVTQHAYSNVGKEPFDLLVVFLK
jgi:oxalate decarboxylase/phosphoglucose isomerase-like protein (cupin superfamily)